MKQSTFIFSGALLLLSGLLVPDAVPATEPTVQSTAKVIDPDTVKVHFEVKVFGVIRIEGRFDRLNGILLSSEDGSSGKVRMRIDTDSVNTRDKGRDDYLRGPTFFAAKRYPHITFSGSCRTTDENGPKRIVGTLNLHGTTKQVVFDIEPVLTGPENTTSTYHAKAKIKRSEFGMDSLKHIVSDEVEVIVAMQTNQ